MLQSHVLQCGGSDESGMDYRLFPTITSPALPKYATIENSRTM
jgi:hypothetical protein